MTDRAWTELDRRMLAVLQDGTAKCGLGFGKYPLGVREAVRELWPALDQTSPAYSELLRALERFDKRLEA